jgi:hypothetical protein
MDQLVWIITLMLIAERMALEYTNLFALPTENHLKLETLLGASLASRRTLPKLLKLKLKMVELVQDLLTLFDKCRLSRLEEMASPEQK